MTSQPPSLTQRARQGYDRAIDVLERAVPVARGLQRFVRAYAALVALAALTVGVVLLVDDMPGTWYTWAGWLAVLVLFAAPPVFLLFFAALLNEVLTLPDKLRALPEVGPAHASELANLARRARADGAHVRVRTLPRDLWRLGRMMLALREDIPTTSVLLSLVRVPMLIATGLAFVGGLFVLFCATALVVFVVVSNLI